METDCLPPLGHASIFDVRAMSEAERARLGYLVLVMRKWPQGFSWEAIGLRLWLPDAGPSSALLKALQREQIGWDEFAERYRAEQLGDWREAGYYKMGRGEVGKCQSTMSPLQHLQELRKQHGLVTALCHERQGNCHRYVLTQLVNGRESGASEGSAVVYHHSPQ